MARSHRDWLFSRQRYWGEPFPIIHWEDGEISTVDDSELPVLLPELKDYKPGDGGQSPLANATEWLQVTDKNGRKGIRETNTMPQWAGSCWYYLRYIDACNGDAFVAKELEKYWMPVDLYVGGAEHAVLHLLYSRFWHKVLFDLGLVSTDEPFQKLFDEVEEKNGKFFKKGTDIELKQIVAKMSKSLKNVVNPDDVVRDYGADSLRLYEMFMGPLDAVKPWQTKGIEGMNRFLGRAWRSVVGDDDAAPVYVDETAPEAMMIFNNEMMKMDKRYREPCETFVKLLHPFAPHIAEEMWSILGHNESLTNVAWPEADHSKAVENTVEVVFQVNGKVRAKASVAKDMDKAALEKLAMENDRMKEFMAGKTVVKSIVVPGKLVNIVVK